MTRPRVVFIGGYGRSGSTLLERLLAEVPGVVGIGELRHLWQRGLLNNERCGCGLPFAECLFWRAVLRAAFGSTSLDSAALVELWHQVDRIRYLPGILGWRGSSRTRRVLASRYIELLRRLYGAIAAVSGCDTIVDSSKEIASGVLVVRAMPRGVTYVHLVRDPRAVAYSWSKVKPRPEVVGRTEYMARVGSVRASWQWLQRGLAGEVIRMWTNGILLRYEDLTDQPQSAIAAVLNAVGLAPNSGPVLDGGEVPIHAAPHSVAGNPMRFEMGNVRIRRDEQWKTAMPWAARMTTTALTLPGLVRFGYVP